MDEHNISDYMLVKQDKAGVVTAMFPYRENGKVRLELLDESIQSALKQHGQPGSPIGDEELGHLLGKARDVIRSLEQSWLERLISKVRPTAQPDRSVKFYKSKGLYRWIGVYSNKWLDNDHPVREIISSDSHKAFAKMVEFGVVEPPEFWLWHNPLWHVGKSEWAVYDNSGFPMAGGYIYPEHSDLIDHIKTLPNLALSHGMAPWSIRRDPDNPHVITSHITEEISLLDRHSAANKLTDFYVVDAEETKNIMVDQNIRQKLVDEWGVPADLLDAVELSNKAKADVADSVGLPSKQSGSVTKQTDAAEAADEVSTPDGDGTTTVTVEAADEVVEVEVTVEDTPDTDAPAVADGSEQIAELVKSIVKIAGVVTAQNQRLEELTAEISALKQADETRLAKKMVATPLASAMALLEKSAVGHDATRVDGRTKLGKSAPEEAEDNTPLRHSTGIPFVDRLMQHESRGG